MRQPGCVDSCRACAHRDFSVEHSLKVKRSWVQKELKIFEVEPVIFSNQRWRYRKKVTLRARWLDGWSFGMVYFRGREEVFVPIPMCPIHPTLTNALFLHLKTLPQIPLYAVIVHANAVVLVLKEKRNEKTIQILQQIIWPKISLFVNWNPVAGKRTLSSKQNEKIFGEDWIYENGVHSPTGFRQQIPELHQKALELARDFLYASTEVVLDFYCGNAEGMKIWESWADTLGVEISSLRAAELNYPGANVLRGRVEDRLPQVEAFLNNREFSVYTNPSRSGHHPKVLEWMEQFLPKKIAYLSCHPRSLAGDLAKLTSYEIKMVQPFDFFPQTDQVETLVLLERKSKRVS